MESIGIVLLVINVAIFILSTIKINKLMAIKQDYRAIEDNIQAMLKENTDIVEVILNELEDKIEEAKLLLRQPIKADIPKAREQEKPVLPQQSINQNSLDIIDFYRRGVPLQEIAEKIGVSQGEIKLKINLYKRMNEEESLNEAKLE